MANSAKRLPEKMTLSDIICHMINQESSSLFARIVASLPTEVSRSVPAMAVRIKDRHHVLMYNDRWIDSVSPDIMIGVVEHEAHHVILSHVARIMRYEALVPEEAKAIFCAISPIAVDLAANSLLKDYSNRYQALHEYGIVTPGEGVFDYMPPKMHYEWYAEQLMQEGKDKMPKVKEIIEFLQQMIEQGSGKSDSYNQGFSDGFNDGMNEHSGKGKPKKDDSGCNKEEYDQGFKDGKELAKNAPNSAKNIDPLTWELLKQHAIVIQDMKDIPADERMSIASEMDHNMHSILRRAAQDHKRCYGTVPGYMQDMIDSLDKAQIPWTKILRSMVVSAQKTKRVRSLRRPHRRNHGIPSIMKFPGHTKDRLFKIVFIIDSSGSMGDRELGMAISELQALQKVHKEMQITVIEADVCINKEYDLKPTDKVQRNILGRGGTDFNLSLKRAKEIKPDICFYFTDGYAPAPQEKNRVKCPFCWVITPNGDVPDRSWGRIIETKELR